MRTSPRRPLSPEAAAVLNGFSASAFSRRTLMRGAVAGGALAAMGSSLAACGTKGTKQTEATCVSADLSATEKTLHFSNWPLYIDVDEKDEAKHPTLAAFEQQSGIKVTYTEDINDNNEFFGKINKQLGACQTIDRDIITMTDWMAGKLVRLGWMQKLDKNNMPKAAANIAAAFRGPSWDPQNEYSVVWQAGLTGVAYNAKVAKEVKTINELLTRADLKGKVTMLSEMQDTMALMLLANGNDPSNFTDAQFDAALAKLETAVKSGQIRKFTGNEYAQDLDKGDIAACICWSGDVIQLGFENENVKWVNPEEGLTYFTDNMMVPNKATHKANAEKLMDYYYDPKVAAEVAAYVNYICPVEGAKAEMEKIDKDLADNPLIFPDAAELAKAKDFKSLTDAEEKAFQEKFQKVIGA
jgi:spermidine/putrescine transport system substrate-binding protein